MGPILGKEWALHNRAPCPPQTWRAGPSGPRTQQAKPNTHSDLGIPQAPFGGSNRGGACVAPRAQPIFCNKGRFGDTKALWESTRWEHFAAPSSGGNNSLHVITYYGVSGASVDTIRFRENERNLALLLDHADSLGHVPV